MGTTLARDAWSGAQRAAMTLRERHEQARTQVILKRVMMVGLAKTSRWRRHHLLLQQMTRAVCTSAPRPPKWDTMPHYPLM